MKSAAKEDMACSPDAVAKWPLSECGLPPRFVRSLAAMHLRNVRELRAARESKLRGIGPRSMRTVDALLQLCDETQSGAIQKLDSGQILARLLPGRSCEVLALRYGLKSEFTPNSNACVTLHEAGLRLGIVRERVRQLEAEAKRILGARPARASMALLRLQFEDCIATCGGIADGDEVCARFPRDAMLEYQPVAFLRLCCDCQGWFTFHRGLFSRFSAHLLREAETLALREVGAAQTLLTIRDLARRIPWPSPLTASAQERILTCLLPRVPGLGVTLRGEVFPAGDGLANLIAAYLDAHGPSDADTLFKGINASLVPGGRRSKQAILSVLRRTPRFVALPDGRYGCKAG